MAIITESELYRVSDTIEKGNIYINFSKTLNKLHRQLETKSDMTTTSVFLSHKHSEIKQFESIVTLFLNLGVKCYLDYLDDEMPKETSGETAIKLKKKINQAQKFILIATDGAIESKWCNWELGFGDAHKYIDNICIFPIKKDDGTWKGNEYLQIYPRIEKKMQSGNEFEVVYPNGIKIDLINWLK